jgi:prephenate dehydratase
LRTAYLGPPGTFSEEALLVAAPGAEAQPVATVRDAILAVQDGAAERAVVPIESATEGSVDETLDTLALDAPAVAIVREVVLPVRHHLVAAPGVALADVRAVASHPQALAQCARFLRETLPAAAHVAAPSTADAVRGASGATAAIGTARAAERYGRAVLRAGVEDNPDNETRFVLLAPASAGGGAPAAGAAAKTSLVFWGPGATEPGWLVRCLSEFAFRGVNLTRIESRPQRRALGAYMFFLDCAGGTADAPVAGAVDGLRAHCDAVRLLGSYPSA